MKNNLKASSPAAAAAPAPHRGTTKRKTRVTTKEPSDFDLFVLVYAFLQTNDYGDAAEKMMREMKRRLRAEINAAGGENNDENDDFDENNEKKKNNNETKMMRKKKMVQMLNGLGKGAKNATTTTTTTVTSTSEQQSSPSPLVRLLPRVKPLRAIMSEFLTMKAKERRRKKSTNEPMKMIFRQCEEAFGNLRKEEVDDDEEEDDDDDDGREGVIDILAVGEDARGNGRKRRREDEDIDAAEALALAAAGANPLEEEEEENNNNNNNDDATAAQTNNTNATGERRNKKKQAAPQRKHKQTIYKLSLIHI